MRALEAFIYACASVYRAFLWRWIDGDAVWAMLQIPGQEGMDGGEEPAGNGEPEPAPCSGTRSSEDHT